MNVDDSGASPKRETMLRDFATRLAKAELEEKDLAREAVEACQVLLQAKQCSVWLKDSTEENLVLTWATGYQGLKEGERTRLSYPLKNDSADTHGITLWIYLYKEPVSANTYEELKTHPGHLGKFDEELHNTKADEPSEEREGDKKKDDNHPCQQFYGAPIYLGEEKFGVLKVENKVVADESGRFRFSEAEKAALDTVAAMLAMALKYAMAGNTQKRESILRDFATRLAQAQLRREDLAEEAVRACLGLLQAERCSIWLVDPEKKNIEIVAAKGYSNLKEGEKLSYPLSRTEGEQLGVTTWIYVAKRTVSADSHTELRQHPQYRGHYDKALHDVEGGEKLPADQHPCQQFYGAPIYLGEEKFGVLKVENKKTPNERGRFAFSEFEKAMLDTVAAMIAMALKYAEASQAEERERILRGFATRLANAPLDQENLVTEAVEACRDLLHAEQCSVWLVDESKEYLVLAAAKGFRQWTDGKKSLSYSLHPKGGRIEGITAWIYVHKESVSAASYEKLLEHPAYVGKFDVDLHGINTKEIPASKHPCQQYYGTPIFLGEENMGN